MNVPVYPSYKDSGIDWLGEIPAHWPVNAIKRIVSLRSGEAITSDSITHEGDYPVFGGNGQRGYTSSYTHDGVYVLIGRQGALCGNVNYASRRFWASEHAIVAAPIKPLQTFWLGELLRSMNLNQYSVAAAQPGLSAEALGNLQVPIPPLPEQAAIAAFLERETAKIDALVEEQRRLIALLKEKRQAVISHAVTKGLNPDAPMKDSGIEWLGEVPAHWEVTALKRLCANITDGAHISPETEGGTRSFVSTKDVSEVGIDFVGCLLTTEASYDYLVRTGCQPIDGDVLFSKDGTIGRTTVVRGAKEFVVASSLIIIRPNHEALDADFLHYLSQSTFVKNQVESFVKGAGLPRLSIQNLLRVVGVFPPLEEQAAIAQWLASLSGDFMLLVNEAEGAISLLLERRSALISAAVTGKIDVRGLVTRQAEAA